MLSRIAREFAAEIANHDWSDAPWRLDRAGHHREADTNRGEQVLTTAETDHVRTNVMWVVAQVLLHADPNLDLHEFATECGVPRRITHNNNGRPSGGIGAGIRKNHESGGASAPGRPV
jgi:hypothetical protein